jgi:chaperone required for assembly of F1-ATPase
LAGTRGVKRRFYKTVTVTPELGIALDGRPVKTPKKVQLVLPNAALAEAVAEEWRGQGEKLNPAGMWLTKLANTAIDRVEPGRARIMEEIVDYAASDLVCYRADRPPDLVKRQKELWDPVIAWALAALDASFEVTPGVMPKPQSTEALRAVAAELEPMSSHELAALHSITTLTGSALLALMQARRAITPEAAWKAAHVDEDYQIEQWGEDEKAKHRRAARQREFKACCRYLFFSQASGLGEELWRRSSFKLI